MKKKQKKQKNKAEFRSVGSQPRPKATKASNFKIPDLKLVKIKALLVIIGAFDSELSLSLSM